MKKENCSGCAACQTICRNHAICMIRDEEGFLYPQVDADKCVNCGMCREICCFRQEQIMRGDIDEEIDVNLMVYVGRHKDMDVVGKSRSGGVFTAISDIVLNECGYVYGAVIDENMNVVHICAQNINERNQMRGSKYVQSFVDEKIYNDIYKKLGKGKRILFVGTSCQVAAAKKLFRGKDEEILYLDIVCHGVVSPLVYRKYIEYVEKKYNSKVVNIDFRNKLKYGWKEHIETLYFNNNNIDMVSFRNIFYSLNATRPSCGKCPYKTQKHPGDITIADCWGIEHVAEEYADDKGCSLIFLNNEKGKLIFELAKKSLDLKCVNMSKFLFQQPLHKAYTENIEKRKRFWTDFFENSDHVFEKYGR